MVKTSGGMAPKKDSEIAKGEEVIIQVYGEVVTEPVTDASTPETTAGKSPLFPWFGQN